MSAAPTPPPLLREGARVSPDASFGAYVIVGEDAEIEAGARIGDHTVIGREARIGPGADIGAHVVIHDGTQLGAGCIVQDGAVLGKRPRLARASSAGGEVGLLRLGEHVTVCAAAVLCAGSEIGPEAIVGDQAYVRERVRIGRRSLIGRGVVVENDVLLGDRVKVQTNAYLTAFTVVEDDVFVGPGAITTNDDTMSRHGLQTPLRGATLRRACRIGAAAVLTPGVEVGEEAFLAAGAVLTRDLPPRAVAIGVPARVVREVGEQDLLERWR